MTRQNEITARHGSIDDAGWLVDAVRVPSPNQDDRPPETAIRLVVVHAISLPPGRFDGTSIADFFTNRLDPAAHPYFPSIAGKRVSAHFLVRRDGAISQFVSCLRRAWHAGISCWRGLERCNDFSLGIELEGDDQTPFTAAQYRSLFFLLTVLQARFPIEDIVAHADIAPGRKTDPGPFFEWRAIESLHPAAKAAK